MKNICKISLVIAIIGSLNWGSIGIFNFNLVTALFGIDSKLTRIVYGIVGIAGLRLLYNIINNLNK
jgi:uncharacterized membrane protein YuzA (DUF378 family)